jgi:hypothetical protein
LLSILPAHCVAFRAVVDCNRLARAWNVRMLPGLQRDVSLKVADILYDPSLDRYQATLACVITMVAAKHHSARLHSVQHSMATAWLNILLVK